MLMIEVYSIMCFVDDFKFFSSALFCFILLIFSLIYGADATCASLPFQVDLTLEVIR